jgi:putative ABC transport system permease protein
MIISLSLSLLIIQVVVDQYSFDTFHEDSDRIYRVNSEIFRTGGGTEKYATTPLPLTDKLSSDFTFFEEVTRLSGGLSGNVTSSGQTIPIRGFYTSPTFFKIFNFEFENSVAEPLKDPFQIVLTRNAAHKFFGRESALGKFLVIEGFGTFTVSGVLKDSNKNTHLEFEALASQSTLHSLRQTSAVRPQMFEWKNYYSAYSYLKIKEGVRVEDIEAALTAIEEENYKEVILDARDQKITFYLQALKDISPGPQLSNNLGRSLPDILLYFLIGLAAIVMAMACLNYTQLTIAKSITRAREIGIRKVIGAQKSQVFLQFVGEAVVISLVSLVFSYLLLQFIKPAFLTLHISNEFSFNLNESPGVLLLFVIFTTVIGIIAGSFPALYLSSLKPVHVLKSGNKLNNNSKLPLRKAMLTLQFTFAVIFTLTVLIINKQTQYMIKADYGINTDNIINVRLNGISFDQIAPQVANLSGVEGVAGVSHSLGTFEDGDSDYKKSPEAEPFNMRDFMITGLYLQNLDIKLLAGKYFSEEMLTAGGEKFVILNEKAVRLFGFADNSASLDEVIYVDDSVMLEVVGVTESFHFRPFNYEIGPIAFRLRPDAARILSIRFQPGTNPEQLASAVLPVYRKFLPNHEMEWSLMDNEIKDAYEDSGLTDISKIVGYISFLAISISCLGLLGMVMFIVQTRSKEIGMRKILGASVSQLVIILNKSSMIILAIAFAIGLPISYLLGDWFLSIYAYRIPIGLSLILTGVGVIVGIVFITIGSQTLPTAKSSPLKWIRYE